LSLGKEEYTRSTLSLTTPLVLAAQPMMNQFNNSAPCPVVVEKLVRCCDTGSADSPHFPK
jgi:hypothetical protein